jgi:aspartyl-tRNA(Asn)/glutamyl-tRNA(Gln) amidotransferase subunit B
VSGSAALAANWVTGNVAALLNDRNVDFAAAPVSADAVGTLLKRIEDGTISGKAAKDVLIAMADGEGDADAVIEKKGLRQISDAGALEVAVDQVLAANAKQVEDYRAGKDKAFNSLVGQVMKATQGKANPAQVSAILKRRLGG